MKIIKFRHIIITLAAILTGSLILNTNPETFIRLSEFVFAGRNVGFFVNAMLNGIFIIISVALLGYIKDKYLLYILSTISGLSYGMLSSGYIYTTGGIRCIFYCMLIWIIIMLYDVIIYACLNKGRKIILNDLFIIIMMIVVITLENYVLTLF